MTSSAEEHEAPGPETGLCRREPPHDARGASAKAATFEYELFVVHADADEQFVHGYLLPAVGLPPERVRLSCALGLGAPRAAEIERGVQTSRLTVVVLSPAYLTDRWSEFGEQLASYTSGVGGRLVPLLRAECKLPLRIEFKVPLDFKDPASWAEQAQRLRAHLRQRVPAPEQLPCPYPGMRAFSAETAPYFHEREAEVDEMVGRLRAGEREIYVIGPSGSGKSSLVEAGVLPRLARGVPGVGPFLVRSMRPGEQPSVRLSEVLEAPEETRAMSARTIAALLAHRAPDASMLIIIDQLEELFTLASADESAQFLADLRALRAHPRCGGYPATAVALEAARRQLPCPELEGSKRGDAERVTRGANHQLRWVDHEPITDDAHRDPVDGFEGRWLAGFAPVGATGFVVIVQTRYDAAIKPNARLSRRLASRMSAVILVSIVVFGASLRLYTRRRRRTLANAR